MKHILVRHHPEYWDGSIEQQQSFLNRNLSVEDVANMAEGVIKQNREKLIESGTWNKINIWGTVGGVGYRVGIKRGKVAALFPDNLMNAR